MTSPHPYRVGLTGDFLDVSNRHFSVSGQVSPGIDGTLTFASDLSSKLSVQFVGVPVLPATDQPAIAERLSGAAERSKGAVPVNVVVPLCGSESKFCV